MDSTNIGPSGMPRVIERLRTDEVLAQWRAAGALLDELGRERAIATLRSWAGVGIAAHEAEHLAFLVGELDDDRVKRPGHAYAPSTTPSVDGFGCLHRPRLEDGTYSLITCKAPEANHPRH